MKKIHSKLKALEWSQHFSHYKSMGIFSDAQGQVTHKSLNFEPIRDFMGVHVACKNEEDSTKKEGAGVVTTLYIRCSDAQGQLTLKSLMESCQNSNPSKLLWLTLLPARMKKIHWKMKVLEWSQRFSHYKSMGIFPNAQGHLTHKSFFGYCSISNPSKILWLSSLPARITKNQSKMKELEWLQGFPHYSPIGAICCHANQSSYVICSKTECSHSPTPMMLLVKFDYDWPAGLRDIYV